MIIYHFSRGKYRNDLSGRGAELAGGRWNSKGIAMLYTSESIALCTVEIAVHMSLGIVPIDYFLVRIEFPDNTPVKLLSTEDLPDNWRIFPHSNATQKIGDVFVIEEEYLVFKVPSAIVQGNYNYIINPRHKDFNKVSVVETAPFGFDKRLFVKD